MKKITHILTSVAHAIALVTTVVLAACSSPQVEQLNLPLATCAPMPHGLASAACSVVGQKAYLFGGRTAEALSTPTFYIYDAPTDSWQESSMPIGTRVNATACTVGDKIYVGLGYAGAFYDENSYLQDWWCYAPSDNSWTPLAAFPSHASCAAIAMSDGQTIYVCYGTQRNFRRDVWAYHIADDSWEQLPDDTPDGSDNPPRAQSVSGAACNGHYYLGTGHKRTSRNFWVEMMPGEQVTWRMCAPLPATGRCAAVAAAAGDHIYLAGGRAFGGTVTDGDVFNDIFRYSPAGDSWVLAASLPEKAENMAAFVIGDRIYFCGGNDMYNQPLNTLYSLTTK